MHRAGPTLRRLAKYGIVLGGGTCILAWASMQDSEVSKSKIYFFYVHVPGTCTCMFFIFLFNDKYAD